MFEDLAQIPVRVELASEFRYRRMILDPNGLVIIVSQSGETADSLAALRLAKQKGLKTLGIVNVVGSSIAREADNVFYTLADMNVKQEIRENPYGFKRKSKEDRPVVTVDLSSNSIITEKNKKKLNIC